MKFVIGHRKAIERDFFVETGHELREVGRNLSWSTLDAFLSHIKPDSALAKELNPKIGNWSTLAKTNAILASIYDLLAVVNANLCAKGTGKKPKKPKPYPRPWDEEKKKPEVTHFGKGALPPDELRAWFASKEVQENG